MAQPFEGSASDMNTECFDLARRVRGMAWAYERIARDAASTTDAGQNLALIDLGIAVLDYVDRCMKDLEAEAERRMTTPAKS
ncbi:hypothetical protein VB618_09765 [Microvirga sp. CF3062]|uniref:hypothetical protein n=1 Tax=Microvirga sp. CF3062 TaxID=3110182 RepID=UPI002E78CBDF|nr:hypothetical protein [Microvirga sp. CF3062]MEE1656484.1 hypothetical protein [Microvirga sp. CF3062]